MLNHTKYNLILGHFSEKKIITYHTVYRSTSPVLLYKINYIGFWVFRTCLSDFNVSLGQDVSDLITNFSVSRRE